MIDKTMPCKPERIVCDGVEYVRADLFASDVNATLEDGQYRWAKYIDPTGYRRAWEIVMVSEWDGDSGFIVTDMDGFTDPDTAYTFGPVINPPDSEYRLWC